MNSVLITGGSGFLAKGLAKRLLDLGAQRVCLFSRGEFAQAQMRREFQNDERLRFFIGDVRDKDRLEEAMRGVDTVIAAAALKRIEVGAYSPTEMVKTNVLGTMNTVEAAVKAGVHNLVYVSTDKAWQPISPYGHTKALAERIVLQANTMHGSHGPACGVVRYGNVWLSRGSVVPTWRAMIADGAERVPITDPACTRFFMLLQEAVDFVLNAVGHKELLVPETLPAYRLGDLAEAMGVETYMLGLPTHEKLHEGMRDGLTSDAARRMSIDELKEALRV